MIVVGMSYENRFDLCYRGQEGIDLSGVGANRPEQHAEQGRIGEKRCREDYLLPILQEKPAVAQIFDLQLASNLSSAGRTDCSSLADRQFSERRGTAAETQNTPEDEAGCRPHVPPGMRPPPGRCDGCILRQRCFTIGTHGSTSAKVEIGISVRCRRLSDGSSGYPLQTLNNFDLTPQQRQIGQPLCGQ